MPAVSLVVKTAIVLVMLASMLRAFWGRPASPRRPRLGRAMAGIAVLAQAVAVAATLRGQPTLAAFGAALGVEAICLAVWLGWEDDRRPDDDEQPPDDGPPGDGVPPFDWDAFDRERRSWDRSPAGAR
jgi:hypothetical protein